MFIQFTNNKELTYNVGDERVAECFTTRIDRYLHQKAEKKPVLLMMPHPFAS